MPHRSSASENTRAEERFLELLESHRHRIMAFIAKQLINQADSEDVFQNVCVVLWKKIEEYDPDRSFFSWACGIAYNEVRNFRARKKRDRLTFDNELVDVLAREAIEEEDISEARSLALRNCAALLSERKRGVLNLSYSGKMTLSDQAVSLGIKRDALYKMLARIRTTLLKCINDRLKKQGSHDEQRRI